MMRPWSARFFVVSEEQLDAQLRYFTNSERTECKGTINVQEITEIRDVCHSFGYYRLVISNGFQLIFLIVRVDALICSYLSVR